MSAATAMTRVTSPSGARTTKTALMASDAMTFCRITRVAWRAPVTRAGQAGEVVGHERDVGGFDGGVGACRAHRDADGAAASAGASLMPSPTIATGPCRGRAARRRAACPRAAARRGTRRRPPARRTAAATRSLSPVSITTRSMPARRSPAIAAAASGRGWSARPKTASARSCSPSTVAVCPSASSDPRGPGSRRGARRPGAARRPTARGRRRGR